MSEEKNFKKITEQDKRSYGVVALALRPNQRSTYGEGNLSGKQLQERFDRLANLVIDKYNAMAEVLSGKDVLDYLNMPDLPNGTKVTLKDLVDLIVDANLDLVVENPRDKDKSKAKLKDILNKDYSEIERLSADLTKETEALRTLEGLVETFLTSAPDDNGAIDKLKEVIAYITANRDLIEVLTAANDKIREDFDTHEERFTQLVGQKIDKSSISDSTDSSSTETVLSSKGAQALKQEAFQYTDTEAEKINKKFEDYLGKDALDELFQSSDGKIVAQKDLFVGQIFDPNKVVTNRELSEKLGGADISSVAPTLLEIFGTNGSYGLEYYIDDDHAELSGIGNCTAAEIVIGSKVKGKPVTELRKAALRVSGVKSVVIPEGVTVIRESAFYQCSKLRDITIPNSITRIEDSVFFGVPSPVNVYISDIAAWCNIYFKSSESTPVRPGNYLYLNGEVATDIVIPQSITEIKRYAFYGWQFLRSVSLPNALTKIGFDAFCHCESLASLTIPDSVSDIESGAFSMCSTLTYIKLPDGITDLREYLFSNCISLENISIPNSVQRIHYYAFQRCFSLKNIVMPNELIFISDGAFLQCTSLESIVLPNTLQGFGVGAFEGCSSLKNITIPLKMDTINNSVFRNCSSLTSVTIPVSIVSILTDAFSGCSSLADVYYSGSEEEWNKINIGYGNEALTNATIHHNYGG